MEKESEKKSTGDLSYELMEQSDLSVYIKNNRTSFGGQGMQERLAQLYDRRCVSKAELARRSCISEVYMHQVFSGRRRPSRDRLLCICFGLELTLEETQDLLKRGRYAQLYPRLKREAIIAHGIVHHTELRQVNEQLFAENEETLF